MSHSTTADIDPSSHLSLFPTLPAVIPPTTRLNFLKNWWQRSATSAGHAEARLLQRMVPRLPSLPAYQPLKGRSVQVPVGDAGYVNTFILTPLLNSTSITSPLVWDYNTTWDHTDKNNVAAHGKNTQNLVICHGYGAGLGFFYKNFFALGQVPGWNLYAIDWLGMGRSSRPKWTITKKSKQTWDDIVEEVETHFVQSLEEWRKSVGLEKMTLMGHSLGGYFATCYSLKYPERVEKLILVSPAGVSEPPKDLISQEPPDKTPQELLENEAEELGASMQAEAAESAGQQPPTTTRPTRRIPSWARYLWDHNITPMSIVRMIGPFGASLVNTYTSRRFAHLTTEEQHDLYDYIYQITSSTGSGEYALAAILSPGAYARKPLFHRLAKLKVPAVFIYGTQDWMDYQAAEEASKKMQVSTKVIRTPGGHHMYIDDPEAFNRVMVEEMKS
ncbi:Alpha/Beta hydrolase protein [Halteromyces radiatus]|uniref:Alpha/Beta hydrolase protein n=1 Tax=Halteromyces radiatus TaxID=101107 RepID=UPI00221ED692|nr:Alpha/Beta hydrolase protein [Halteromyces radiatus]KAI8086614.1 Alpha/Beta hydrolase protein [Halteromyces radiatus]